MKRLLPSSLLVLLITVLPALPAAEKNPGPSSPAGKSAANVAIAGRYSGNWKGDVDGAGDLRIALTPQGATWGAEASFTFEGAEVAATIKSIEVDGAKIQLVFDWKIQGTAGQSKLTGELTGGTLQGKYETTGAEGSSSGTWKVTRS